MTTVVTVLLVETDELVLRERTEQLLMDGYAVDAVSHIDQARDEARRGARRARAVKRAGDDRPAARATRRRDPACRLVGFRCWCVGVDDDSAAVRYYRAGADVALPSESSGLLVAAGLEALARRAGPPETRVMRVGSLTVDRDARTAQVDGRPVKLTRLEFDLLATLASEPRRTFTRAELTREVWGFDPQAAGPSRTVDSHAHRLRQKLEQAGAEPMVQTVRGVGWRLTR